MWLKSLEKPTHTCSVCTCFVRMYICYCTWYYKYSFFFGSHWWQGVHCMKENKFLTGKAGPWLAVGLTECSGQLLHFVNCYDLDMNSWQTVGGLYSMVCVLLCINQSGLLSQWSTSPPYIHVHRIASILLFVYFLWYNTHRELDEGTSFVALSHQYMQLLNHM